MIPADPAVLGACSASSVPDLARVVVVSASVADDFVPSAAFSCHQLSVELGADLPYPAGPAAFADRDLRGLAAS